MIDGRLVIKKMIVLNDAPNFEALRVLL